MKKRLSEEHSSVFEGIGCGVFVVELCRKHGFSHTSYNRWKVKFVGMDLPDARCD